MTNPCIRLWRWADAPEKYRRLSQHGGDEDYVAYIPNELQDVAYHLDSGSWFGVCDVQLVEQTNGSLVLIGAHA